MAYSDEQRPEAQFGNQSRNSLNIQQPGETDSYDVFFSDPNRWKDNSTSFSLGDVLPTMGKGVAQSVRGAGEMARGLGDAMIQSPVKTGVSCQVRCLFVCRGKTLRSAANDVFAS